MHRRFGAMPRRARQSAASNVGITQNAEWDQFSPVVRE
jgi:hypothetical protein